MVYILTYIFGIKITDSGIPYEKKLTERIKEPDLGAEYGKDINKASKIDFMKIKGIGEVSAKAIIKRRKELGDFRGMEDLLGADNVGEKRLETIKKKFKIVNEEDTNGNN